MIAYVTDLLEPNLLVFIGVLAAFAATCLLLSRCSGVLPRDHGRDFAVEGALSEGKPRGAGFLFILVFLASALIFGEITREIIIYLILIVAAMMSGFLDDCARTPWGELKKGLLDLAIAVMTAVTFLNFNSASVHLALFGTDIVLHPIVYGVLAVILVWVSINVTNCSDGVDGLSGTVGIITLMTVYLLGQKIGQSGGHSWMILFFAACILGYLWFNATPSRLLMGDAGSRAMGLFISIAVLKSGCPFFYIPAALVFILDGGLGLVKVSLLRYLKIKILKNTRTPLHDHVRKVWNWSNTQTVFRFAIIQIVISAAVLYLAG